MAQSDKFHRTSFILASLVTWSILYFLVSPSWSQIGPFYFLFFLIYFYVICYVLMFLPLSLSLCVCVPHAYLVPFPRGQKRVPDPWNISYRWL